MAEFTVCGKQILRDGEHYLDACDEHVAQEVLAILIWYEDCRTMGLEIEVYVEKPKAEPEIGERDEGV